MLAKPKIYTDTRQQAGKHEHKNQWWRDHGVELEVRCLKCGDYSTDGCNVIVDTKRNIAELAQNLTREHSRVRRAYALAVEKGWKLIILVENEQGFADLDSISTWVNDRCCKCLYMRGEQCDPYDKDAKCRKGSKRKPVQGPTLAKIAKTMERRYGVRYMFCEPSDSARVICDLLGVPFSDAGDAL